MYVYGHHLVHVTMGRGVTHMVATPIATYHMCSGLTTSCIYGIDDIVYLLYRYVGHMGDITLDPFITRTPIFPRGSNAPGIKYLVLYADPPFFHEGQKSTGTKLLPVYVIYTN